MLMNWGIVFKRGYLSAQAYLSLEMPAQSCLFFIQILIHIQSNMLESLMKILEDALDINLSKFVRRYTFSEEVVSVPVLQVAPSASSPIVTVPRPAVQQEVRHSSLSCGFKT